MKVLICGASVEGLTLAWCLARHGHGVTVVDRDGHLSNRNDMLDLFGAGYDVSERLGLARFESIHDPVDRLVILDAGGRERVSIPYPTFRRRVFNDRHLNVMRRDLLSALYERARGCCDVRFGATVVSLDRDEQSARVRLSDDSLAQADLLVGADGLHSLIRRLVFGVEGTCRQFLGHYAVAAVIDGTSLSLQRGRTAVTLTLPNRQVTVHPIRRGGLATLFLYRPHRAIDDFSPEAAVSELKSIYGDLGGFVQQLLDRCKASCVVHFDVIEQVRLARWSVGRVVLVGEACHGVSPLPGQGTSLSLAGAYVLGEALEQGPDPETGLAWYERQLRPAVRRRQAAARRISKWVLPSSAFGLTLRNVAAGMSLWPPAASILRRRLGVQSIRGV